MLRVSLLASADASEPPPRVCTGVWFVRVCVSPLFSIAVTQLVQLPILGDKVLDGFTNYDACLCPSKAAEAQKAAAAEANTIEVCVCTFVCTYAGEWVWVFVRVSRLCWFEWLGW